MPREWRLNNVSVNVRLPRKLISIVRQLSGMEDKTQSQWIREAVEDKLSKYNPIIISELIKELNK